MKIEEVVETPTNQISETETQTSSVNGTENGTPSVEGAVENPNVENKTKDVRTFTQEEVNKIIQDRLARTENQFFETYGVKDGEELKSNLEKSKTVDTLSNLNTDLQNQINEYKEEKLFRINNIDENRIDDLKTYFKGKDIELTEETLKTALTTHPEWIAKKQVTTIQSITPNKNNQTIVDEKELAANLFGLKSFK